MNELQNLLNQMKADDEGLGDWSSLETFGGDEPALTSGVWSWDETHMIVGSCAEDVKIVPRNYFY
jgi:hypothetical protein